MWAAGKTVWSLVNTCHSSAHWTCLRNALYKCSIYFYFYNKLHLRTAFVRCRLRSTLVQHKRRESVLEIAVTLVEVHAAMDSIQREKDS